MILIHEAGDRPRVAMSSYSLPAMLTAWDWLSIPTRCHPGAPHLRLADG